MNYVVWQYIFGFFLIASVICITATIFLSIRYRLICLIRSDVNLKKDKKKYQDSMNSVNRIIDGTNQYRNDSSQLIRQTDNTDQKISNPLTDDDPDFTIFSENQNNNEITELLHETNYSDDETQIINNHCCTKTDDISSENTVIAHGGSTSTVIINNNSSIIGCKSQVYDSFIMVTDIKITNGQTDEIKKFR